MLIWYDNMYNMYELCIDAAQSVEYIRRVSIVHSPFVLAIWSGEFASKVDRQSHLELSLDL